MGSASDLPEEQGQFSAVQAAMHRWLKAIESCCEEQQVIGIYRVRHGISHVPCSNANDAGVQPRNRGAGHACRRLPVGDKKSR